MHEPPFPAPPGKDLMSASSQLRGLFTSLAVVAITHLACGGSAGKDGTDGTNGTNGKDAILVGSIRGVARNVAGDPLAGVAVTTSPASGAGTTLADGSFALSDVSIGSYSVVASKTGYVTHRLPGVGVAAGATTNVALVLSVDTAAPGAVSGKVTDSQSAAKPLAGVVVRVQGTSNLKATTTADGSFTLEDVPPGPVFLTATAADATHLDTETREAIVIQAGSTATGIRLALSSRPSDTATYVGANAGCVTCHPIAAADHAGSAHFRSLTRIERDGNGHASAGGFSRMLNPVLTTARVVMVPLAGTISATAGSTALAGSGTAFATDAGGRTLQAGDEIGYTPTGLVWTKIGIVASVDGDTQLTLTASPTFAPGVASIAGSTYGVRRLSRVFTHMLPEAADDVVAPAWPGVKATNPNYDANDPCIYGNAAANAVCAAGGTTKYADGQVNVYLCNLKDGVTYLADEYVQKFGGSPYTCGDGAGVRAAAELL